MTKITAVEKKIFQEAYQITALPVFHLQLLLAPVLPKFRPKYRDLEKQWITTLGELGICEQAAKEMGDKMLDHSQEVVIHENGVDESESMKKKEGKESIPRRNKSKNKHSLNDKDTDKKKRIDEIVMEYTGDDIENNWWDDKFLIGKDLCHKIVGNDKNDISLNGAHKHSKNLNTSPYIGVRIIDIYIKNDKKIKILIMIESVTKFASIELIERITAKKISTKIIEFMKSLSDSKIKFFEIKLIGVDYYLYCIKEFLEQEYHDLTTTIVKTYNFNYKLDTISIEFDKSELLKILEKHLSAYNIGKFNTIKARKKFFKKKYLSNYCE